MPSSNNNGLKLANIPILTFIYSHKSHRGCKVLFFKNRLNFVKIARTAKSEWLPNGVVPGNCTKDWLARQLVSIEPHNPYGNCTIVGLLLEVLFCVCFI